MTPQLQTIRWFGTLSLLSVLIFQNISAQNNSYTDSLNSYQQNYINTYEVVGKDDKKFIHFYPVDESYRVTASFKKISDAEGFYMNTASGMKQKYFHYGLLAFELHDSLI